MLCGVAVIQRIEIHGFDNVNSDMWPLQSGCCAWAGDRKMEVFTHANQSFQEKYKRNLSLLKLMTGKVGISHWKAAD